ncbi:hypothetical protein QOZ80_7BG0590850 [Eleusine coracana subsp. coracana]|nr:hypothetical protein QOZ80_7BG0590850 [Eleusine coracana subsp. coracana]
MRRAAATAGGGSCRRRVIGALVAVLVLYALVVVLLESPLLSTSSVGGGGGEVSGGSARKLHLSAGAVGGGAPARPTKEPRPAPVSGPSLLRSRNPLSRFVSGLDLRLLNSSSSDAVRLLVSDAVAAGARKLTELEDIDSAAAALELPSDGAAAARRATAECPQSIALRAGQFRERGGVVELPCGLALGSHVTVAATPRAAHAERDPTITALRDGDRPIMVSQFIMELQGLKTVEGEDPPRILHFNPRLRGDWSGRPVIEQNTCYRMQWGTAQRCEGWISRADEETVDGLVKCEKWIRDGEYQSEKTKTTWWLNRLVGMKKEVNFDWPYPFVEGHLFILTLSAGMEGYHISVDGRHVTSFPYRTGFVLEDATGLSLNGDLDVESVFVGSLPTKNPSVAPQSYLDFATFWQAPPLPNGPVEIFIGILSSGNHFAERMGVRKTWMSSVRKSSNVVARFFVALHARKEVNVELQKEAEFFRDIVFVPFLDNYDLVVLKTLAICDYGVHVVSAKYIMKCDDDNFVRLDSVVTEIKKVPSGRSLYLGNINFYHRPLRQGKWAVSYEEWPEEVYPPYANGPGYVISSDIADFIMLEFTKKNLRLFKMEDVSMGLWVEQFNRTRPIEYIHNVKFCQFGCINDYYTAHYQSPRLMLCMWQKLLEGKPECCNVR